MCKTTVVFDGIKPDQISLISDFASSIGVKAEKFIDGDLKERYDLKRDAYKLADYLGEWDNIPSIEEIVEKKMESGEYPETWGDLAAEESNMELAREEVCGMISESGIEESEIISWVMERVESERIDRDDVVSEFGFE